MKIVFLLRGFVNGGVERRIVNLANGFATCGHYVEIAVFQGNCLPPAFEVDKNVSFYFFSNTVKEKIAEHRPDVSIEQDECGNNAADYHGCFVCPLLIFLLDIASPSKGAVLLPRNLIRIFIQCKRCCCHFNSPIL